MLFHPQVSQDDLCGTEWWSEQDGWWYLCPEVFPEKYWCLVGVSRGFSWGGELAVVGDEVPHGTGFNNGLRWNRVKSCIKYKVILLQCSQEISGILVMVLQSTASLCCAREGHRLGNGTPSSEGVHAGVYGEGDSCSIWTSSAKRSEEVLAVLLRSIMFEV